VFPVHPRTRQRLKDFGLAAGLRDTPAVHLTEPLSYIEFMSLIVDSRFALTDSGGVQEETSYLGIPCLTLRDNTERPVTVALGTNRLVKAASVDNAVDQLLAGPARSDCTIPLWDGQTAPRVVASLRRATA
jgi:UDP-N-acetylglucosamine 2-epimerase (non-hydrolysing)